MIENWIKDALRESGISQAELTRRLHERFRWPNDRSIVNKILNRRRTVSAREALQISQVVGVPLPEDVKPDPAVNIDLNHVKKEIDVIFVRGKVAANTWMDVDAMDFGYEDVETIPSLSGYPPQWQFGLKVDGNCLNKVAAHGDILVCLDLRASNEDVMENDLVIVERKKFGGQMVERTAKRVRNTSHGYELWPESTDPAHQQPIILNDETPGIEVQVIGKVLWILKRP